MPGQLYYESKYYIGLIPFVDLWGCFILILKILRSKYRIIHVQPHDRLDV